MERITFTITNEDPHEFEFLKTAHCNASKNQLFIDCLYQDYFRQVIKYSEDESKIKIYQELWDKISEGINE
jgi:hypothetical protein